MGFTRGHTIVNVYNPWSTHRSYGLHNLSFACKSGPYRGQLKKLVLLPFLSFQYWHSWLMTIIVLFYNVYLNTLDICLLWILSWVQSGKFLEGSAQFLRVFLFFDVSNIFGGSSKVVRVIFPITPARARFSVPSDFL